MIDILDERDLRIVSLNRPEKANSLTSAMLESLCEAVEQCDAKVLILTGEGKVFSAGADLEEAKAGLALSPLWERLSGAIARFRGLSIAALNGTLAGGAMGMALACDMRIAVPGAKFFYPVMKLGFLPQPSDPKRMRALIGPARTKLIFMAGERVLADEALRIGLVDRVVEPEALMDVARALAEDVMGATREHAAAIKAMIE